MTAPIPNPNVGPQALRALRRQPITSPPPATQTLTLAGWDGSGPAGAGPYVGQPAVVRGIPSVEVIGAASVATTTVFTLAGAFSLNLEDMPAQLGGAITANRGVVLIPTQTVGLFLNTVQQNAALLNKYMLQASGKMVLFGHSLGAVAISYWVNNFASVPASQVTIYMIGNSVSPYGGALGPESGAMWPNWFGSGVAIPAGTAYPTWDIKAQYDGWTDWPTGGTPNLDATLNAFAGQNLIHPNYENISPSPTAPGNVAYTTGNVTYIWSMTKPVPLFGTTWNSATDPLDLSLRPTIESAYNRPVSIPPPTY